MSALRQIFEIFPSDPTCLQPLGICVDGIIAGLGLSAIDRRSGEYPGDLEAQLQTCMGLMRELMERAGASLDNVGRAVCYVTRPGDRDKVYETWERLFPDQAQRPAFKVLTGPLNAHQLVRLDVLALPGSTPRRIDIDGVPARDPTVLIGDYCFTSRLHGISPQSHETVAGLSAQLHQALVNVEALLRQAGMAPLNISQLTLFARDDARLTHGLNLLEAELPAAGPAARHGLETWVRADSEVMVEVTAARPDALPLIELFVDEPSNQADGIRLGPLIYAPYLAGNPEGRETGTEEQIRSALRKMDSLLQAAGASRREVARVSFYMKDLGERPVLNQVWQEWFPDPEDRPPHTYLPAALPAGRAVALQVIALAGAGRRVIKVEGVEHGDPMSLGAVTGNLLTSSRIFGAGGRESPEGLAAHAERCFANASALLTNSGCNWGDMCQLVAYGSSAGFRSAVAQAVRERSANARVDFRETDLGRGTLLPRLQLLGLIRSEEAS